MTQLEEINKELDALATRRARFGLLALAFLLLVLTALVGARDALRNEETEETVAHFRQVSNELGQTADLPTFLGVLYPEPPAITRTGAAPEPVSTARAATDTALSPPALSRDSIRALVAVRGSLERKLDAVQDTAISRLALRYEFFGVAVPLGLAYWSVLLPFGMLAALAFLVILNERYRSLYTTGVLQLAQTPEAEKSVMDRLRFTSLEGRVSAFVRHPGELSAGIALFGVLLIFGVIGLFLKPFVVALIEFHKANEAGDPGFYVALRVLGLYAAFLLAYVTSVKDQIRRTHAAVAGTEYQPIRVVRAFAAAWKVLMLQMGRIPRAILALAGSTPIVLTLVLVVALDVRSCNMEPATGLDLLTGEGPPYWFSAVGEGLFGPSVSMPAHYLGTTVYVLTLVFALVALAATLQFARARKQRRFQMPMAISKLAIATCIYPGSSRVSRILPRSRRQDQREPDGSFAGGCCASGTRSDASAQSTYPSAAPNRSEHTAGAPGSV